jgi:hypothetical protein
MPVRIDIVTLRRVLLCLLLPTLLGACSVKKMAVDVLADSLADGGGVYTRDDDPQLVYEAIPFGLKTYEGMLEVSPDNRNLLLTAASGFAGYAYLTREKANRLSGRDVTAARHQRARASRLFLRARDFALRALTQRHPDLLQRLESEGAAALAGTDETDIAALYWAGASWAGAISAGKGDLALVAELPQAAALVERVLELDETYDAGAAHEFMIAYEGGRPGGSAEAARVHYARALTLSQGLRASVHLALAEAVVVDEQDLAEFRRLLDLARGVDPDAAPEYRLLNTIAVERADWLEDRIPELFLDTDSVEALS